ncbi:putative thiamin pyrophosphokinase, vitamin B1 binding domain [Lyophyllum shimeji]|uniref:Thiamine pyrophosphokinase n=1 Tax=Lyophyllum shimeji TaxID=47721 RepID=A0A9P3PQI8_LYOSH|nr:putative thiamin pyrophosphokinase, vitamin B1 binding domain [Lyophyllum shimeji]
MSVTSWNVRFLSHRPEEDVQDVGRRPRALIILDQPFVRTLLERLWNSCALHCCADGGANRLYDTFADDPKTRSVFVPNLIKGDLDSIRDEVRAYYAGKEVPIVHDEDQGATDLMKCVAAIEEKERIEGTLPHDIVLLGGLAGRLDHTIHTLSYLHRLRKTRPRTFAVTDDNVGWVLDSGEHVIHIDHDLLGRTCGLLPVGIDETILTTSGLRWNLNNTPSSFDGLVSTSNHLVPEENEVRVKTTKPIWWTVQLKPEAFK